MKKVLFIFALVFSFVGLSAQNYGIITGFGTAADTLVANATKTYEFTYVGSVASKCEICLFSDSVSGTPAYTAILYKKYGTLTYLPVDTITHSGGGDKTAVFEMFYLTANKYKVTVTATSAPQKSRLYLKGVYRQ